MEKTLDILYVICEACIILYVGGGLALIYLWWDRLNTISVLFELIWEEENRHIADHTSISVFSRYQKDLKKALENPPSPKRNDFEPEVLVVTQNYTEAINKLMTQRDRALDLAGITLDQLLSEIRENPANIKIPKRITKKPVTTKTRND